ncbi:UPF0175 family protein [Candidatus Woesearchaeota archaeon]|nr:UPF0175 family protein [Candidatus Woesearchaeota archaeon]
MAATVTTRLPNELNRELNKISKIENLDKSAVMRRLLADSIKRWNEYYALAMYQKGIFSTEQAADFIGVSLWRFSDMLNKNKTPISYDVEEFEKDLKNIK